MIQNDKWANVFKNGSRKICGRQPLKNWSDQTDHITSNVLKAFFHKYYDPFLNALSEINAKTAWYIERYIQYLEG